MFRPRLVTSIAVVNAVVPVTTPADRSNSPPIINSATATAMMPRVAAGSSQFAIPFGERKTDDCRAEEQPDGDRRGDRSHLRSTQQGSQELPAWAARRRDHGRFGLRGAHRLTPLLGAAVSVVGTSRSNLVRTCDTCAQRGSPARPASQEGEQVTVRAGRARLWVTGRQRRPTVMVSADVVLREHARTGRDR